MVSVEDKNEDKNQTKISLVTILIGVVGFFISLYALILHIQHLMQPGRGALCDINAALNCSNVIGSSYGELASIPLGSYGMTYFIILISASILPKISLITKKQQATLEIVLGLIGFVSVLSLFYISHSILKVICPVCSLIHILVVIYFIMKTISFFKNKNAGDTPSQNSDYFIRFIAVCICLGIPPLAAGLVAPIIIDKFFSSPKLTTNELSSRDTPKGETAGSNPIVVDPAVAPSGVQRGDVEKLLPINKTNYVGNGEDYRKGRDDAKVVVQIFSDFGCPHCKEANSPLMEAQRQVGMDKVLIVYRFFPLSNKCNPYVPSEGWYPYSCVLPQAARCAGVQGKFWEFKDWGYAGQEWTDEQRAQNFTMAGLKEEAKNLGMNVDAFSQCMESGAELNKIKEDAALADKLKIKGTPLILINGQEYDGPHSVDAFTQAFQ